MALDTLPPLREVIASHGLRAKKSLGQNFLLDLNLTAKIARAAGSLDDCPILEIGPGPGGLTRALLAQGAKSVTVIERDERCLPALAAIAEIYPQRLNIIHADALTLDMADLFKDSPQKPKIIANLPYNIGTQLLLNWISSSIWPPFYHSLTLMFQREVALRLVAAPNTAAYGRLSVLTGWRCQARILFDIEARAFTPPPKVTSSLVHLEPNPNPLAADMHKLARLTAMAFGQRRKMLRQSLKPLGGEALLKAANIDPTRRAETLTIAEFINLTQFMHPNGQGQGS